MKKIFYLISASLLALLVSCQEEIIEEPGINFSPEKVVQVDLAAQEVSVKIESGDNWTLSGEYDWITPSAVSGKDGDEVTFTIALNTSAKIRAAVYEIKTAKLVEKLVIKQIGTKIDMSMEISIIDYDVDMTTVRVDMDADDLDLFTKWGLKYVAAETWEELNPADSSVVGTDVVIEGAPEKGIRDITIEGLAQYSHYKIWCWLENADGVRLYSDVNAAVTAKALSIKYEIGSLYQREFKANVTVPMNCEELGLCWGLTENPTVDGSHLGQTGIISSAIDIESINTGELLKPETTYKVRPYVIKKNGETVYGDEKEITTMKDPFVHFFRKEGNQGTWPMKYFNALSEWGPYHWGSKGMMNANPGSAQGDITERLRSACNYVLKTPFQYIYMLFNQLEDGTPAMSLSIHAGKAADQAKNKGTLVFKWNIDENGYHDFEYMGPGSQTDAVNDFIRFAEDDIQYVINYFDNHTFYFEYCSSNITNFGSQYSGFKMREIDDPLNGYYDFNIMNTQNPSAITVHEVLKKNIDGFYVIKNAAHWAQFCELVNDETGANAVLANDIDLGDLQASVGSDDVYYKGTFDGQGHTLTVNYTSKIAPFIRTDGATIKNLRVAGVIKTTARATAGFISRSSGKTTIENCISSILIWQTGGSGWQDNAGFVSNGNGELTIIDCLFDGSFRVDSSANEFGGFVGWRYGTVSIKNCLFAPTSLEGSSVHNSSGTFCPNTVILANCWYTQTLGSAQGSAASADDYANGTLADALNAGRADGPWTVKDGKTVLNY